ncbi:hypothetical protein R1sor_026943 [Riccia sorocarpa]|uniref:Uncharacterized protein n=1 Tax=Riccia sorocarpa TaxID=122646 RepID=A0ABD3GCW3_9MARC
MASGAVPQYSLLYDHRKAQYSGSGSGGSSGESTRSGGSAQRLSLAMAAQRQITAVSSGNSQRSQYSTSTGAGVNADQSQGYKATEEIDFPSLHATPAQKAKLQNAQRSATHVTPGRGNSTEQGQRLSFPSYYRESSTPPETERNYSDQPKNQGRNMEGFSGGLGGQNPYEDESDDDFIPVKSSRGNSAKDVPIASPKAKTVSSNVYEVLADNDEETEAATQQLQSTNKGVHEIEEEPDKLPEDIEIAQNELAVGGNSEVEVLGNQREATNNWMDDSQKTQDRDTLMKTQGGGGGGGGGG